MSWIITILLILTVLGLIKRVEDLGAKVKALQTNPPSKEATPQKTTEEIVKAHIQDHIDKFHRR